ncbi:MAG: DUF1579 family protein [Armatimonadetes bacterium]|nr:DUF1579 family protein [Armatimonadota bacterium]
MKAALSLTFALAPMLTMAQGHDLKPADTLKGLGFMKGQWVGKQEFNTGGDPMVGDATNTISEAIGGRYLEERLSTTLTGRPPSDTRHFVTYDPKAGVFRAWWFNDSSNGAMELEGKLEDAKLVLTSKPTETGAGPSMVLRATYDGSTADTLVYKLELKQGENWQLLFTTTYHRKA